MSTVTEGTWIQSCIYCDSRTVIPRSASRTCTSATCKERELAEMRATLEASDRAREVATLSANRMAKARDEAQRDVAHEHARAERAIAQRDRAREALRAARRKLAAYLGVCSGDKELPKMLDLIDAALADAGAGGEEQGAGGAEAPSDPPRSDPGASAPGRPHPPSPPPPATGGACDPGEWDERLRWHTCRTHPGRVLPADVLASQDPSRPMCVEVPAAESAPAPPDDDCAHDAWTVDSTGGGRRCVDCGECLPDPPAGGGEWAGSARVLPPQPAVPNEAPPPARGGEGLGEKARWRGGRKDMRTLSPFDDGNIYAHFLYEPDPPGYDTKDPKTWGRRWMILGPADGSEGDPQRVVDSLAEAINAERAALARENAELRERVDDWEEVFGVRADPDEVGRTFARALEKQDGRIAALERENAELRERCDDLRDRTTELARQTRQHRARIDTLERLIEAVPVQPTVTRPLSFRTDNFGPWLDALAAEQAAIRERRGEGEA